MCLYLKRIHENLKLKQILELWLDSNGTRTWSILDASIVKQSQPNKVVQAHAKAHSNWIQVVKNNCRDYLCPWSFCTVNKLIFSGWDLLQHIGNLSNFIILSLDGSWYRSWTKNLPSLFGLIMMYAGFGKYGLE